MRAPSPLLMAVCSTIALVVTIFARPARALGEGTFDGRWRQGPLKEDYTVQQWLSGCGPAPVTGNSGGGEEVSIHEEGDELSIVGGGRVYRTNQCYDQLPTLARESHSRDSSGRSWRTRCTTPAADPRHAAINTAVFATSDGHIDVVETGRYDIALGEGRCIADIKRSRSFDLIRKEDAPTASAAAPTTTPRPTASPTSAPAPQACTPGEPSRLEVRPSKKLMRPGETSAFRAVVTDARGCPTGTPTSWVVPSDGDAPKRVTVDSGGRVTVPADAAEGVAEVVVTAAGKSARVTVEVASAARYDDLLTKSGLNAAGENDAASFAEITTGSIGGADAHAEDAARRRKLIFVGIIGGLVLILAVLAFAFSRRARKAASLERDAEERHAERVREAEERRTMKVQKHAADVRAHQESVARVQRSRAASAAAPATAGAMVCPSCRREYPPGSGYCSQDANRLVALAGREDLLAGPSGGICPVCKRGFDPGVKVCPTDNEELVPYALSGADPGPDPADARAHVPGAVAIAGSPTRGKICPTCGGRFEGVAAFCGKDGTALVLLN